MKNLHVVWSLDDRVGGLMRAVVAIASLQADAGHQVTVASTTTEADTYEALKDLHPGVTVQFFARSRLTSRFAGSKDLRRWVRNSLGSFDSVHVHSVWDLPSYTTAHSAARSGVPLVVSPHGSLDPYDVRKHALAKRFLGRMFMRAVLNSATTVLCTTRREANDLITYGAKAATRVVPIPLSVVDAPSCSPAEFRQKWEIPDGQPLLLFLSRFDAKKGLTHLLGAVSRMQEPAHLLLVGAGEESFQEELQHLIGALGLEARITRTGWLSGGDKAAAFAAADLFVLLSDFENYGIAVVEALQHGLPSVTSTEVYAGADLAQDGAVLIAEREPRAAAEALDYLLSDESARQRLRERGQNVLVTRYSNRSLASAYTNLTAPTPLEG